MKNIWRIFSGDMKRLVRNPFALVIAIGLCIIPSLYAWFNIYSNWDPYANTKNIKIAVATEDTGYQMDDGTTVNMGDSVIESLKEMIRSDGCLQIQRCGFRGCIQRRILCSGHHQL